MGKSTKTAGKTASEKKIVANTETGNAVRTISLKEQLSKAERDLTQL